LEMAVLVADRHDPQERGQASLVTMHASKGLEFKVVMCVGMEEGTFPHHRSLQDSSQLNEERRLAFVALTRARDLLYLTSRRTVPSTTSHQMPKVLSEPFCVCLDFDAARLVLTLASNRTCQLSARGFSWTFPASSVWRYAPRVRRFCRRVLVDSW
jgi:ATP-dependent exoDNAse (exonuclease V) beta subunit